LAPQQPSVFDLPKVLAVGIVSPAAAAITSRFGITGTLVGLFLSSVFITAGVDLLKVYLARVPGAVTSIPGGFRRKSPLQNIFERMRRPFSKFASLPPARRRSLLVGSVAAAGISCLVGLILITVLEVGVGKNLSCWVWEDCSTVSSSADGSGTTAQEGGTLPTILSGVQSVSSSTQQQVVSPSTPQQQPSWSPGTPGSTPGAPWQEAPAPEVMPGAPGAETPKPSPSAQPGQRQGPSGIMQEDQQQIPSSSSAPADQQQRPAYQQPSSADNSAEGQ
jgi:hypothetical protein